MGLLDAVGIAPGNNPPPAGPFERSAQYMMQGGQQRRDQQDMRAYVPMGVQRLQSIGTEQATQAAQLLQQNPRLFFEMAKGYGGAGKWEQIMRAEAMQLHAGQIAGQAAQGAGVPPDLAALYQLDPATGASVHKQLYPQRKIHEDGAGVPRYVDSGSPVFEGDTGKATRREIRQDSNDVPRYVDSGEPVFPGVEKVPTALTPTQQANAAETQDARRRLTAWMRERKHTPEQMRRIIAKGSSPFDFGLDDTSEDRYAAQLWSAARHRIPGSDPDFDRFIDSVVGGSETELASTDGGQSAVDASPAKPRVQPLPKNRSDWIDGETYVIQDPETGKAVAARYDAERGGFEF